MTPVVLFCYNRPEHTQMVLDALSKNPEASATDLWIFSDGPKVGHEEKVNEVRNLLNKINDFHKVNLILREKNLGLSANIRFGVTEVLDTSEQVIVLEDDLVPSKNFLAYMNQGLDYFRADLSVHSVSAFLFPFRPTEVENRLFVSQDCFVCPRFSCWGWGIWRDRWSAIDWKVPEKKFFLNHPSFHEFHQAGNDLPELMLDLIEHKNNSWAVLAAWDMVLKGQKSIYPCFSKVKNIGFDGTGVHSKKDPYFQNSLDDGQKRVFNFKSGESNKLSKLQIQHFKNRIVRKVKNFIQYGTFF